jgi:hypothetical protein
MKKILLVLAIALFTFTLSAQSFKETKPYGIFDIEFYGRDVVFYNNHIGEEFTFYAFRIQKTSGATIYYILDNEEGLVSHRLILSKNEDNDLYTMTRVIRYEGNSNGSSTEFTLELKK